MRSILFSLLLLFDDERRKERERKRENFEAFPPFVSVNSFTHFFYLRIEQKGTYDKKKNVAVGRFNTTTSNNKLLAKDIAERITMHSMQRIDATSCYGSRLSTHFSSGKTASISNRKMYINNVVNDAQNNVSRINNKRHEETVASRIQLKREQNVKSFVVERIGSERVRFSRSRRGCFARVSKVFFFSHRNNPQQKPLYLLKH